MRSLMVLAAAVLFLGLAGCGEFRPVGPDYHYTRYTVQRSDTLYSIAFRFGYDYHEVAGWNGIPPPYIIHAGDELLILDHPADEAGDEADETGTEPTPAPKAVAKAPPAGAKGWKPSARPKSPVKQGPAPVRAPSAVTWHWPTKGRVVAKFAAKSGRKGVDLAGNVGQSVRAAADGDVVYSGSGLIGYGNLVIIKHDETFLSAYGHNRKLLVREGDKVRAGQPIGEMGRHAKSGSILHFEIRKYGKPVDPLLYLPNQTS